MEFKTSFRYFAIVCVAISVCGSGCGSGSSSSSSSPSADPGTALGQRFAFSANQPAAGWQQQLPDAGDYGVGLWTGTASGLYNIIDGAAGNYATNGCTEIMLQNLANTNSTAVCTLYAADCGTSANATAMFAMSQKLYTPAVTIAGYDPTIAFGNTTLDGIRSFAHFGRYYFDIDLSGYAADPTSALADATTFIGTLSSKSN